MRKERLTILPGRAYPLGCYRENDDIYFSAEFEGRKNCGLYLFHHRHPHGKRLILLDESCRTGNIYSAVIPGVDPTYDSYMLYEDGRVFFDPYARRIRGLERWEKSAEPDAVCCEIENDSYDWRGDIRPEIPYADSLFYCLHVRGYTKMKESGAAKSHRGTFRGLADKIPYLQSLGVTAVELLPIYERRPSRSNCSTRSDSRYYNENGRLREISAKEPPVNYWGFQEGCYFAPRAAYCADASDPVRELRDMIRAFHNRRMEVILQFYFAEGTSQNLIVDCIRYWVSAYHIDGIHIKSDNIPLPMLMRDPMLSDIKLIARSFPEGLLPSAAAGATNLAVCEESFALTARRFLKSEDNVLSAFLSAMLLPDGRRGRISYICNYSGFTLRDLVSYEHKHNEANGENNADGRDDNFSWNCGAEGRSRRRAVLAMRRRQMLNALTFVFFAQGTPMLYAGDEFGNSQEGNNNAYCQDNPIGWTDWRNAARYGEVTAYVRFLSALRRKYSVLRKSAPYRLTDYRAYGYPDLSYHGTQAWRPDLSNYSHSVGMLYCGFYAGEDTACDFIYVVYNMYWKPVRFALPGLPAGLEWYLCADTAAESPCGSETRADGGASDENQAHAVRIYVSRGKAEPPKRNARQSF